jgi:hypothetical protein
VVLRIYRKDVPVGMGIHVAWGMALRANELLTKTVHRFCLMKGTFRKHDLPAGDEPTT